MKIFARSVPSWWKTAVVYQIHLRTFTPEGTLAAAEQKLSHIASLGVDFVYLCPVVLADDDMRMENWSARQRQSGTNNPKNSYRISDYFAIDPEYGTEEDLMRFIKTAHSLDLRVMLDLVYMHCGPRAKIVSDHPDFIKRDAAGNAITTLYNFPLINFDNEALREYFYENMLYFVRRFDVDGYRLDVGDACPLDFWCEGAKRVRELKPEFIFLNEGRRAEFIRDFCDANYGQDWTTEGLRDVLNEALPAYRAREQWEHDFDALPQGALLCRAYENHDTVNDAYEQRLDKKHGIACGELLLAINFMLDGVPFLYSGNEIADHGRHSFFANRFTSAYLGVDWSMASTEEGKRRMQCVKHLISLKKREPSLSEGSVLWRETEMPDHILSFSRVLDKECITVVANLSGTRAECTAVVGESLMSSGVREEAGRLYLSAFGYAILKSKTGEAVS